MQEEYAQKVQALRNAAEAAENKKAIEKLAETPTEDPVIHGSESSTLNILQRALDQMRARQTLRK